MSGTAIVKMLTGGVDGQQREHARESTASISTALRWVAKNAATSLDDPGGHAKLARNLPLGRMSVRVRQPTSQRIVNASNAQPAPR